MEYEGKLYGKVGDKFFELSETSQDVDKWKEKAEKWDALDEQIGKYYEPENLDKMDEDSLGLINIGEAAAYAFNYI